MLPVSGHQDARLAFVLIPLVAGNRAELDARVHAHAVGARDLRPAHHATRSGPSIRGMKDPHVFGKARRYQRQHRLAEPAQ